MCELQSELSAFGLPQSGSAPAVRAEPAPQCTKRSTVGILALYSACNPQFTYSTARNPRRQLTKPAEAAHPGSCDNSHGDFLLCVGDVLSGDASGASYIVKDLLGHGTFGQVVRCSIAPKSTSSSSNSSPHVAMKVIKSQRAYYHQARVEVGILNELLHKPSSEQGIRHIVRMLDSFSCADHLCIAFEQLGMNLYELIKQNHFRGVSLKLVRAFISQLLKALSLLRKYSIVHCDVKPENALISSVETGEVKLIDFGSACFEGRTVYTYIQSRFYRSPEVLLGCSYGCPIDAWSIGSVAAELFLGLPLFPGASELNMLHRITETLGPMPSHILQLGTKVSKFYKREILDGPFELMSVEEYEQKHNQRPAQGKRYLRQSNVADLVHSVSYKRTADDSSSRREYDRRNAFADFLLGLLRLDSSIRWTPDQALKHPFITGQKMQQNFEPPGPEPKASDMQATKQQANTPTHGPHGLQRAGQQAANDLSRSMPMPISGGVAAGNVGSSIPTQPPNLPSSLQGEHGLPSSSRNAANDAATQYLSHQQQDAFPHSQHGVPKQQMGHSLATAATNAAMTAAAAAQAQDIGFTAAQHSPQIPSGTLAPRYSPRYGSQSASNSHSGSGSGHHRFWPMQSPHTPSGMEHMASTSWTTLGASAESSSFLGGTSPSSQQHHHPIVFGNAQAGVQQDERASPNPAEWDPNFSEQQLLQEETDSTRPYAMDTDAQLRGMPREPPYLADEQKGEDAWRKQQQQRVSRGQGVGNAFGTSPPQGGSEHLWQQEKSHANKGQRSALTMALSQQQQQQQQDQEEDSQKKQTNDERPVREKVNGSADVWMSSTGHSIGKVDESGDEGESAHGGDR